MPTKLSGVIHRLSNWNTTSGHSIVSLATDGHDIK